ncbi:MAG: hypothetical protein KAI43_02270 [Candidatus Aureabacteria bacterium]|nr:hypothetical protein [Candidatus Auribacterota bacterium]
MDPAVKPRDDDVFLSFHTGE